MPKLNIDKSQICPENHKALIIHAEFLPGFPSFLKPPVFVAGSVRGGTNMRLEAQFNAKKKEKIEAKESHLITLLLKLGN